MIKHFFSVLIVIFIFLFTFFVISTYVSIKNINKIKENRADIDFMIKKNAESLLVLKNDTNNVIEFNSGYNSDNNKIKRNFWNLFKKND
jgi:hypothetical protein